MDDRREFIDFEQASALVEQYLPMFEELNDNNIEYCVVGGLGVLLHAIDADIERYRFTTDADVMVDAEYPNSLFAEEYLSVYAGDSAYAQAVYDAMFQEGDIEQLSREDNAFVNISFIGAQEDLDSIQVETLYFNGTPIRAASVEDLVEMKQSTIELLKTPIDQTSRLQDYQDLEILKQIQDSAQTTYTQTLDEDQGPTLSLRL